MHIEYEKKLREISEQTVRIRARLIAAIEQDGTMAATERGPGIEKDQYPERCGCLRSVIRITAQEVDLDLRGIERALDALKDYLIEDDEEARRG